MGLAPRAGQRSSVRAWASVERIGTPPAVAEPDQGRVVSVHSGRTYDKCYDKLTAIVAAGAKLGNPFGLSCCNS